MKVCFYITSMTGGGAEGVFLSLINYLADKDVTVELVLNRKKGPYLELLNDETRVYELDADHAKDSVWELKKYLDSSNPDVAVSTLSHCNYALILARFFSKSETKILVREANSFLSQRKDSSTIGLLKDRLIAGLLYRLVDKVFTNSEGSKKELIKATHINESHVEVLPNPLNLEFIQERAEEDLPEEVIAFLKRKPYILAVGRLEKAKGFDILIEAFSKLRDVEHRLIILGEGKQRTILEKLINQFGLENKVLMPGYVENPYSIMKNAELFVLSSRYEGMPNVLLEAMALGVPIVAADCPSGPRELLKNGQFGSLVPVDDEVALAEEMKKNLGNNIVNKDESKTYIRQFGIKKIGSRFFSLLKRLTSYR